MTPISKADKIYLYTQAHTSRTPNPSVALHYASANSGILVFPRKLQM